MKHTHSFLNLPPVLKSIIDKGVNKTKYLETSSGQGMSSCAFSIIKSLVCFVFAMSSVKNSHRSLQFGLRTSIEAMHDFNLSTKPV